jgi:hypothetical protein
MLDACQHGEAGLRRAGVLRVPPPLRPRLKLGKDSQTVIKAHIKNTRKLPSSATLGALAVPKGLSPIPLDTMPCHAHTFLADRW